MRGYALGDSDWGFAMLAIFFCFFLFASGIFANKLILATLSPSMLSGIRMLVSGLIIFIFNYKSYRGGTLARACEHWKAFVAIALFTNFIPTLLKAYAIQNLSTAKAGFLGSLDPFVTALYVYILLSESLTIKKWLGILLGFSGALLLTTLSSPVEATLRTFMIFSLPEIAAFASVAVSRLGWILVQKKLRANTFSPVDVNGIVMTLGGIFAFMSIPLWQALGFKETFNIVNKIDLRMSLLLAFTILVGNLGAYNLYAYLLKYNSSTLMSIAGFTVPIYLAFFGWFFLGEPISATLIQAGVLMMLGVAVFYYDDVLKDMFSKKNDQT